MGQTPLGIDQAFVREWSERYQSGAVKTGWHPGPKLVAAMQSRPALHVLDDLTNYWDLEDHIFSTIGPSVRQTGSFTVAELVTVAYWKTPRPLTAYLSNEEMPGTITSVTREALSPTEPELGRRGTLRKLNGVGVPVASAILTVWSPDDFTIIDVWALRTLSHFNQTVDEVTVSEHLQSWWERNYELYLKLCRSIVDRVAPSTLRDVDRALWKWGQVNATKSTS